MNEPRAENTGAKVGLFFLGLVIGAPLQLVYSLFTAFSLDAGSGKTNVWLYELIMFVPIVLIGLGAWLALRSKRDLFGMFLIGAAVGVAGPLLICSAMGLTSGH